MLNRTRLSSLDAFGLRDQRNRIYPALEASDGSTLSLDFTQMSSLDSSGFTLSRATGSGKVGTATYINSNGYVATANANVPRFDYDPTTLTPRGLLMEGSATNLIVRSEDFSATSWTIRGNVTTTGNTSDVLDPAGGNTATKVVTASGGSPIYASVAQPVAVTANTTYTMSFWIRGDAGNQCRVYAYSGGTPGDLVSQTTYTYSSTGWTRVQTQFTTGAGHSGVYVYVCSQSVTTAKTFYIWGAQLEAGSGASSYIPTSASTVTRAVDKVSMTNISLMGWNQTAGTFLWHMDVQSETNTSSYPAFAGMYRAGPVRVIRFQLNNSSGVTPRVGGDTWTATPSVIATSPFYTRPVGTPFKSAVAFANTGQSMTYCINGSVQSAVTGTGTLATPTLLLMHQDPSAADTEYFPIHLRQLKYWPTTLSSSDLRSITL